MKRKIIKLGTSTLVASLPSKWIRYVGLKPGDEVELEEKGNTLVIQANASTTKSEITIKLTKLIESSVRTIITNAYRLGYDRLKVYYINEQNYKVIHEVVKTRLIGFSIIKKEKDFCIIENITEPSVEHFSTLLEKMIFNITELLNLTKERLSGQIPVLDYKEVEENIQQYDNFCKRVLSKRHSESKNPELFWMFLTGLVHGQREIYHLNKDLDKRPFKAGVKTLQLLDELAIIFDSIKKAYFKKDNSILEEVHEHEKKIVYEIAYKVLPKNGKENVAVYHITAAARNFYLAASPLMGLIIQET